MSKSKIARRVEVRWTDARSVAGWKTQDQMKEWINEWRSKSIATVGWLIREDKESVIVSFGLDFMGGQAQEANGLMEIPKGMVTSIVTLVPEQKRRRKS